MNKTPKEFDDMSTAALAKLEPHSLEDYDFSIGFENGYKAGYVEAIDDLLAGIQREQRYHEFLDKQHAETRHPILACKEIASYARALRAPAGGGGGESQRAGL